MAARRLAWKSRRNARKSGCMHIVPDANIIIEEGYGSSGRFRLLLFTLEILQHNMYVPKLVIEEVVARFERAYHRDSQRVEDILERFSRFLGAELPSPLTALDKRLQAGLFRSRLNTMFDSPNCSILEYPSTSHAELTRRASRRIKPFSESGSGYRDALIWESALKLATDGIKPLAFISNDNAFCDTNSGKLHSDLVNDLRSRGLSENDVILARSVEEFFNAYIRPTISEAVWNDLLRELEQSGN